MPLGAVLGGGLVVAAGGGIISLPWTSWLGL
jgi:ribulose 1,5-bisphosphate carboxylase large subunit-like protein